MKHIILLLVLALLLPACFMFHKVPDEVVKAADYAHRFAAANQSNLTVVNNQYYAAWRRWMENHGGTPEDIEELKQLHAHLQVMTYEAATFCTQLTEAIYRYLSEPNADLSKLIPILNAVGRTR